MKIKFDTVQNPKRLNYNVVTGVLSSGESIEVSRRQVGWNVQLVISIDGVPLHNDNPTEADREEFNKLMNRAADNEYDAAESKRKNAFAVAWKEVFSHDI